MKITNSKNFFSMKLAAFRNKGNGFNRNKSSSPNTKGKSDENQLLWLLTDFDKRSQIYGVSSGISGSVEAQTANFEPNEGVLISFSADDHRIAADGQDRAINLRERAIEDYGTQLSFWMYKSASNGVDGSRKKSQTLYATALDRVIDSSMPIISGLALIDHLLSQYELNHGLITRPLITGFALPQSTTSPDGSESLQLLLILYYLDGDNYLGSRPDRPESMRFLVTPNVTPSAYQETLVDFLRRADASQTTTAGGFDYEAQVVLFDMTALSSNKLPIAYPSEKLVFGAPISLILKRARSFLGACLFALISMMAWYEYRIISTESNLSKLRETQTQLPKELSQTVHEQLGAFISGGSIDVGQAIDLAQQVYQSGGHVSMDLDRAHLVLHSYLPRPLKPGEFMSERSRTALQSSPPTGCTKRSVNSDTTFTDIVIDYDCQNQTTSRTSRLSPLYTRR